MYCLTVIYFLMRSLVFRISFFFFLMIRRPPRSTLFPYTTALPISDARPGIARGSARDTGDVKRQSGANKRRKHLVDRKSTRLNSSHSQISYAVFCLKKKTKKAMSKTKNKSKKQSE